MDNKLTLEDITVVMRDINKILEKGLVRLEQSERFTPRQKEFRAIKMQAMASSLNTALLIKMIPRGVIEEIQRDEQFKDILG